MWVKIKIRLNLKWLRVEIEVKHLKQMNLNYLVNDKVYLNLYKYYHHNLSRFLLNPPLLFIYCLYTLLEDEFFLTPYTALLVWFLFLEVWNELNPIIFII